MSAIQPPSLENYLPYGELLRVFLDQGGINSTEMRTILRGRGVFLSTYDKATSVPHLSFATVTPKEFAELLESQRKKEDSQKTVHSIIPWISNRTVEEAMPKLDDLGKLIEEHQTCKITNISDPKKVGNNPNHIEIEFELERHDFHKSWVSDTVPHIGRVVLQKVGNGSDAKFSVTSTIPETKGVCKNLVKNIKKELKTSGDISVQHQEKFVQFSSFDNAERVKFLLSLTKTGNAELSFKAITDSDVSPDPNLDLPAEIKPLLEKIRQMSLKGDELQDSILLKQVKYHQHILLKGIVVRYRFDYQAAKGFCTVNYNFAGHSEDSQGVGDFEVGHGPISIDAEFRDVDRVSIRNYVRSLVDDLAFSRSHGLGSLRGNSSAVPKVSKKAKRK